MYSRLYTRCTEIIPQFTSSLIRNSRLVLSACPTCTSQRNQSTFVLHNTSRSLLSAKSRLLVNVIQIREKKWDDEVREESDSDSDDEIMRSKAKGIKVSQIQVDSLRADAVIKHGLGMSRNKVDVLFYEDRIRINGRKINKKSHNATVGDEVDVIKDHSADNPNFIIVSRVEIVKVRPSGDYLLMTIRRYNNLLIENYEQDPWEQSEKAATDGDSVKSEIDKKLG